MTERWYTRTEIFELLEIEDDFLITLERESIIAADAPPGTGGEFSAQMFERVRVAYNLVNDLKVNLAGAGIIVRMREELFAKRRDLERVLDEIQRRRED